MYSLILFIWTGLGRSFTAAVPFMENISAKLVEVKNEINTLKSSKHKKMRINSVL